MKQLLLFIIILIISINAYSQGKSEMSNADIFLSQNGYLFEKQFIEIGKFKKVEVNDIIVKSINGDDNINSIRLSFDGVSKYSAKKTYYASIDEDEIDDIIIVLDYISKRLNEPFPQKYTELIYKSRSGFSIFAYTKKRMENWQIGLQLDQYEEYSLIYFLEPEIKEFKEIILKAQSAFN